MSDGCWGGGLKRVCVLGKDEKMASLNARSVCID